MAILDRHPCNPILSRRDIPAVPFGVSSVFNPGATFIGGEILLLLRVQNRARETFLMRAHSADGVHFEVRPEPVELSGLDALLQPLYHVYDPRISRLEGQFYVSLALDLEDGCRLGLARSADLERLEFLGLMSAEENRNGVLFPARVGGRYLRLDRPNRRRASGVNSGDEIWLSASDDLLQWQAIAPVLRGRPHRWDELIGAGPPPVLTPEGWLLVYHGVATHFASANIYQAGVALLDRDDPSKVIARARQNILEPRELYELVGQVPNVVFPSGWVVEDVDAEGCAAPTSLVKLYYGAADTCVGLAQTTIQRLIDACFT